MSGKRSKAAAELARRATAGLEPARNPKAEEFTESEESADGQKLSLSIQTRKRIDNPADALRHANMDPRVWRSVKVRSSTYQTTLGTRTSGTGRAETVQMFAMSITFTRRLPDEIVEAVDLIAQDVRKPGHKWPAVRARKAKRDPATLVVGLSDHHFGKLAYAPETGDNYDLKIARELYARAMRAAAEEAAATSDLVKCIIPIGNDHCHVDTRALTTEKGTPLDADGRYPKIIKTMEESMILAIREMREVCPVELIWIPGNHDHITSHWLCRCMHWAFEKDRRVTVDTTPNAVKYRQFGRCLLGFAHGDGPKPKRLMSLMPVERATDWGQSPACREWLTGHLHTEQMVERRGTDEEDGVKLRVLPSLCGTDNWHRTQGFFGSRKLTQNLLYSHQYGIKGITFQSEERLLGR